jgi:hypothetical protein
LENLILLRLSIWNPDWLLFFKYFDFLLLRLFFNPSNHSRRSRSSSHLLRLWLGYLHWGFKLGFLLWRLLVLLFKSLYRPFQLFSLRH